MSKHISKAVIARLPRYYRYLTDLQEEGIERISSGALSERMHVTASQIRQDLNHFGEFGQQGYGYNVAYLLSQIGEILGLDQMHHMIIIGSGRLGQALAHYRNFEKRGFKVVGMFDVNPDLCGSEVSGQLIRSMEDLPVFLKEHSVDMAALTIPVECAQETAALVTRHGIRAIWNFSHAELTVPEGVQVENVHLSDSLMRLSFQMKNGG